MQHRKRDSKEGWDKKVGKQEKEGGAQKITASEESDKGLWLLKLLNQECATAVPTVFAFFFSLPSEGLFSPRSVYLQTTHNITSPQIIWFHSFSY